MSVTITVPEVLYRKASEIAKAEHVSVDEVFAAALAQQVSALDRIKERAKRGSRDKFLAVLDKSPDVEPDEYDRL
jgi:predicted transcriptional regulator